MEKTTLKQIINTYSKSNDTTIYSLAKLKSLCKECNGLKSTGAPQGVIDLLEKSIVIETVNLVRLIKVFYSNLIQEGIDRAEALIRVKRKIKNIEKIVSVIDENILDEVLKVYFDN